MWAKWANANSIWQTVVGDPRSGVPSPTPTPNPVPTPNATPTSGESVQGTSLTGTTGQITDAAGVKWTLVPTTAPGGSGFGIAKNGVADGVTQQVTLLLYYNHQVYQDTPFGWWYWNGSWIVTTDPRGVSPTPTAAPSPSPVGTGLNLLGQSDLTSNGSVTAAESALGRQFDTILVFIGNVSSQDWQSIGYWFGQVSIRNLVVSTGINYAGNAFPSTGEMQNNANALFSNRSRLTAVRIGWEFNFADPIAGGGSAGVAVGLTATQYVTQFRAYASIIKNTFKAGGASVLIDWCPNWDANDPTPWYPGDDLVDIVGMDIYNNSQTYNNNWSSALNGRGGGHGLDFLDSFSASHNKLISFPEWATDTNAGYDGSAITNLAAWMKARKSRMAYNTYWNSNANFNGALANSATQNNAYNTAFRNWPN